MTQYFENPDLPGRVFLRDGTDVTDAYNMGAGDAFMESMGHTISNIGRNTGVFPELTDQQQANIATTREQSPWMTDLGQAAGQSLAIPGGALAQVFGGGAIGALTADQGDMARGGVTGAVGGGLGHLGMKMASRVLGGAKQHLTSLAGKSAKEASETGTPVISAGEAMGWDWLKAVEQGIKSMPGGQGAYDLAGRQRNINQRALAVFGLDKAFKSVDDDAVVAIKQQFKDEFGAVADQIPRMDVPADLADDIRAYGGKAARTKRGMENRGVSGYADTGEPMTGADGESLMRMRSKMLDRTGPNNSDTPDIMDAIDDLDDLIEANSPAGLGEDWAKAREKYRFYKIMDKSLNENNVSAAKLSKRLRDWNDAEGAIGDVRTNVKALRSDDFSVPHGTPGTANQILGVAGAPFTPLTRTAAGLLNSAVDVGTIPTRWGGAAGRAGLLQLNQE